MSQDHLSLRSAGPIDSWLLTAPATGYCSESELAGCAVGTCGPHKMLVASMRWRCGCRRSYGDFNSRLMFIRYTEPSNRSVCCWGEYQLHGCKMSLLLMLMTLSVIHVNGKTQPFNSQLWHIVRNPNWFVHSVITHFFSGTTRAPSDNFFRREKLFLL